jgi:hypothetical protein
VRPWVRTTVARIVAGVSGLFSYLSVGDSPTPQIAADAAATFVRQNPASAAGAAFAIFLFGLTLSKRYPLGVLATRVKLTYCDVGGRRVQVERNQMLRARRPNITMLTAKAIADFGHVECNDAPGTCDVSFHGEHAVSHAASWRSNGGKNVEFLNTFTREIPFPFYASLFPDFLLSMCIHDDVQRLKNTWPTLLKGLLVHRRQVFVYVDEYSDPRAHAQFSSGENFYRNITVEIELPPGLERVVVKAMKLIGTSASEIVVTPSENKFTMETHMEPQENLRITVRRLCRQCATHTKQLDQPHCDVHASMPPAPGSVPVPVSVPAA